MNRGSQHLRGGGGAPPFLGGAGGGGAGGGGGMASFGGMGVWTMVGALFTRGNATEGLKLLMYGLLIELGRRIFSWVTDRIPIQPCVSARFVEGDPAYEWVMLYLTEENVWRKSRDFDVTAKSTKRKFAISNSFHDAAARLPGEHSADYVPKWGMPHVFRWRKYWVDVVRSGGDAFSGGGGRGGHPIFGGGDSQIGQVQLTFFTLRMSVLSNFVEETRKRYVESNRPRVTVHLSDAHALARTGMEWGNVKTKVKRPLSTVALPDGVMSTLVEDVREFLALEDWYVRSGIPHHRGYLLHGPPGTGKTSTIYALAGELGLEIYSLSLSASHIDDAYLQRLASSVPRGAMLLVEDIDCAFPSREDEDEAPKGPRPGVFAGTFGIPGMPGSAGRVTLSGLLNVIDGVGSDEGRLFFATTNHYDRLDPALVRPGRIDMKVEYERATESQARALFNRFFPAEDFAVAPPSDTLDEKADSSLRRRTVKDSTGEPSPAPVVPFKGELPRPLAALADEFARAVPTGEFSPAELQGYLLRSKFNPVRVAEGAADWVAGELAEREMQKARDEKARLRKEAREGTGARRGGREGEEWGGSQHMVGMGWDDPPSMGGWGGPPGMGGPGSGGRGMRGGSPGGARGRGRGGGTFGWNAPAHGQDWAEPRQNGHPVDRKGEAPARERSSSPELESEIAP